MNGVSTLSLKRQYQYPAHFKDPSFYSDSVTAATSGRIQTWISFPLWLQHTSSLCVLARKPAEKERETLQLTKTFYLPFKGKASELTVWDVRCKALQKVHKCWELFKVFPKQKTPAALTSRINKGINTLVGQLTIWRPVVFSFPVVGGFDVNAVVNLI